MQNELRLSQQSLRVLAADTGGFAAVNQNDFNSAFDRIVRENSSYYLLGYYPTNDKRDGRFRKLRGEREGAPEWKVQARSGYVAPRAARRRRRRRRRTAPRSTRRSPRPSAARCRSPAADESIRRAVQGHGAECGDRLVVEIDASKLDFVEKNGTYVEKSTW